ncbi:MAG: CBS domain-containing protein [Candidatus Cloacimonetes bacterium]|nr:CBS domain-containing protein [Candidatus Cloacimonadota bacterium]
MNRELKELFDIRKNVIHAVKGDTTIKDAVDIMNIHHIGALIVLDDQENVIGIFSERDVMKKLASTNDLVGHLPVKEIMTPKENLITIDGEETIGEIMEVMTDKGVRHLPIIDKEGVLHGLISMRDIFRMLLRDARKDVNDLTNYVTGKYPA